MQHPRFMQREELSLQSLYEHNYWLFRLLLPDLPVDDDWYALYAPMRAMIYIRCLGRHAYTSEWQLGHFYPQKRLRRLAPDFPIRVYHDARLVEAMVDSHLPIRQLRQAKLAQNRALAEWLDYCRRYQYRLEQQALDVPLDLS
ncbi:MAG: DUF1249 domain-containing protein [Cardiobacteriaceae bacterium]|nr:DUF1249 domain-containing protein [Cardiobacteriaceae bacterium]